MIRRLLAFISAVLIMAVLGSVAHSLFVQQAWIDSAGAAAQLSVNERLGWIAHDVVGLQPLFGALAAVALLVAFLVSGLVARYTGLRTIVFAVAGAVAIFVLFTTMKSVLGTVGVFGARGAMGLGAQMFAGLLAGLVFAMMTRPQADS